MNLTIKIRNRQYHPYTFPCAPFMAYALYNVTLPVVLATIKEYRERFHNDIIIYCD